MTQAREQLKDDPSRDAIAKTPIEELRATLSAPQGGLSQDEAVKRLGQYGPNALPEEQTHPLVRLLSYFWGPIPWMIEVAAILSGLIRHWADLAIILLLLALNAGVGFWEEFQAGNAVAALKATLALKARVKRDGKWTTLPARDVVPGDALHLRAGDIIPADSKLLDGDPIEVDQSSLTGESLPVSKKPGDVVYSGSITKLGEIDALAYRTGQNTYFGTTAKLVQTAHTVSHFQRAVLKIGDYLIVLALTLVTLTLLVALSRGDAILRSLQFALILTVAAVPVAMPAVLSVTMAVGARNLARKKAIVTRLAAMEEMAGIDLLCVDKTGTLTRNSLTLADPFCMDGVTREELLRAAALASQSASPDAVDSAILSAAGEASTDGITVLHYAPFDPVHKRTETTLRDGRGAEFRITKGAPQVILALCSDAATSQLGMRASEDFALRGFRSLGVGRSDGDGPWRLLGILPLFDPPREDSMATIAAARSMGVAVKMLTGDQVAIAKEMARQVGLGVNVLDASLLGEGKERATPTIVEAIEKADGFAQVFPEQKFFIVDTLQRRGHIVGMTGDGINDAPSLKKADAGIAVSGATDAARAAAAIVLLAPGLSVIIDAIRESREMFQRMNSYATYRIAETVRVVLFMTLSIIAFNFYPVTAIMIVLLAILNDGAILSIAYDRVHFSNEPEKWDLRRVIGTATALGIVGVVASFALLYLGARLFHLRQDTIQSLMYLKLSVAGHFTIFLTRTRGAFWSARPALVLICAVVGTQLLATLIAVYGIFVAPIGWQWAGFVWAYALAWFLVNDQVKLLVHRLLDRKKRGAPDAGRPRPA